MQWLRTICQAEGVVNWAGYDEWVREASYRKVEAILEDQEVQYQHGGEGDGAPGTDCLLEALSDGVLMCVIVDVLQKQIGEILNPSNGKNADASVSVGSLSSAPQPYARR